MGDGEDELDNAVGLDVCVSDDFARNSVIDDGVRMREVVIMVDAKSSLTEGSGPPQTVKMFVVHYMK